MKVKNWKNIGMVIFIVVLVGIAVLTLMTPDATSRLTEIYKEKFPHWMVYPLIIPWGKTAGIRQGAHIYEYFMLGCAAMILPKTESIWFRVARAFLLCVLISNIDQAIKPIFSSREYDSSDLMYDAFGYCIAILVYLIAVVIKKGYIKLMKMESISIIHASVNEIDCNLGGKENEQRK